MALPDIQPSQYDNLLATKVAGVQAQFSAFDVPSIEVFESPKTHYRLRAEFRVWHDGDDLYYVMFEPGDNKNPIRLDECAMVSPCIHDMMFELIAVIKADPAIRFKLFQIDFLSTLSGELLVSLLYHRPIDDAWKAAIEPLRERFGIDIVGRSRKKKLIVERDFVMETLVINGREYHYKQVENSFTQPNGIVCQKMIEWALDVTQHASGDLVEFYCGSGNFTLPLAQNFRRVVACEISKTSVRAAEENIARNNIDNLNVLRMPSEDLTAVLQGKKETRKVAGLDLDQCEFSTVLVDPPRSGLDVETIKQVKLYDNIVYISCNPETLHENLQSITQTHRVERFAVFDQFPYTHHLECGVYLVRK
ncbi:tRNA (uridine(54)-C5)-methyltransferase TrmA [Neptunomonas phycophila]|uniref:tRNA (uridine(54)-C5)-methyltransferase TrmA n=1 Tax=Neptunomonas phycophila TaxID=1572645 RepID=UPI0026E2D9FE|nr:tRNA (uridine(54)-C5)-methyltransferase TrmA [Neptunomonas phycophila]MDO6785027.1 tRNA (uridine(54)-C5)-methyltransferase TrmA [Neptunomonas phycophila]